MKSDILYDTHSLAETFTVTSDGSEHTVGDANCSKGWCGGWGYPKPCPCGGLIHAECIDEDYDNVYLSKKCDKCGEDTDY